MSWEKKKKICHKIQKKKQQIQKKKNNNKNNKIFDIHEDIQSKKVGITNIFIKLLFRKQN